MANLSITYQRSASLLWRGYPDVLYVLTIFRLSREESEGVLKRSWFSCSYARTYLYADTIPIPTQFHVFGSWCHWCITFLDITSKDKRFSTFMRERMNKDKRNPIPGFLVRILCLQATCPKTDKHQSTYSQSAYLSGGLERN